MGIFRTQKALELLSGRLTELEGNVRTLKSANKHLELEWEELYDKVRRQMSRMSKRSALDAAELTPTDEPESTGARRTGVDSISARILERRASNGAKL